MQAEPGLSQYLDQGVLGLTVFALILALGWVVKQWRQAEREKEALHGERLKDAREMLTLAVEVKTSMQTIMKLMGEQK